MLFLSDIAVGSYGSSQVVILYSRPVVSVFAEVSTSPEIIDVRDSAVRGYLEVTHAITWSMTGLSLPELFGKIKEPLLDVLDNLKRF